MIHYAPSKKIKFFMALGVIAISALLLLSNRQVLAKQIQQATVEPTIATTPAPTTVAEEEPNEAATAELRSNLFICFSFKKSIELSQFSNRFSFSQSTTLLHAINQKRRGKTTPLDVYGYLY